MDRIKLNRWLIALIAFAMLILVFDSEEKKIQIKIDNEHPEADYTMEDVTITQYTIDGEQNHKLTAKKMIHYNQQDIEKDNTVEKNSPNNEEKTRLDSEVSILIKPIIFYKNLQNTWVLSANQGRMTNQRTLLFLANQVELTEQLDTALTDINITDIAKNNFETTFETTKVTTSDLKIDLVTKIAQTDQRVNLKTQNIAASSIGMKIDMKNSKVYLLENVHTQLKQIKR